MNRIYCIGMGPGDSRYTTPLALQQLEKLPVVYGAPRLLGLVPGGAELYAVEGPVSDSLDRIADSLDRFDVGVVVSGDPGFYSFTSALRRRFGRENVTCLPGISSLQILASRVGFPWSNVPCVSLHGRELTADTVFPDGDVVILLGRADEVPIQLEKLAGTSLSLRRAWLGWDLGLETERLFTGSLCELASKGVCGKLALLWVEGSDGE